MLSTGWNFSRRHLETFFFFPPTTPPKKNQQQKQKQKKQKNRIWHFMQIVSAVGNNLHEMSNPVFWENKKIIINLSSAELAQRVIRIKGGIQTVKPCIQKGFFWLYANITTQTFACSLIRFFDIGRYNLHIFDSVSNSTPSNIQFHDKIRKIP